MSTFCVRLQPNISSKRRKTMRRAIIPFLVIAMLLGSGLRPVPTRAEGEVVEDTPTIMVSSGVTSYTLAAPKIFWYTGVPICPPAGPDSVAQAPSAYTETINRIATYGSPVRTLYSEQQNCSQDQVLSNMVSDGSFLYWLGPTGLMKLSTDANPGDAPQLVNALVTPPGEVADGGDKIFVIHHNSGSSTRVGYVLKSNNQYVYLAAPGNTASNLKWDGSYVYYQVGTGLIRQSPGSSGVTIATGVTGYYPEGQRLLFCTINPFVCHFSNSVYVGKGRYVYVYDNLTNTLGSSPIYTSVDSTASVYELVTDFSHLFFYERRTLPCTNICFISYSYVLQRTGRGGGTVSSLYTYGPSSFSGPSTLRTDGTFLFWQEDDRVERLPNDASALPQVNMYISGIEVTQSIQDLNNSVLLIKNKRTFVRVYVKSVGTAVPGVTAQLSAPSLGGNPLSPVNPAGTHITVRPNPDRNDINQSFLFELPWSWTQQSSLNLQVILNPYKVPLEPNYSDNTGSISVNFQNSPTLSVEFFRLNYTLNNTNYSPRISGDVLKTYSWILRAYPLGGAIGQSFKPRLWDVAGGTQLGSLVNTSNPACKFVYPGANDDISLCASYFANGLLFYYRVATQFGILNVGLNTNAFYYGMISDAAGYFPRGQAMYTKTSVGPAGTPGLHFNLGYGWDTDGTYADWYAAHEIGHSLGRSHPNAGSDDPSTQAVENCGHSRSDPSYPYGNLTTARAPIGPANNSMEGFDVGDPGFGIPVKVLPSKTWNDVMSYCDFQWLSDYTYKGMYNHMIAHPSAAVQSPAVTGDFLAVSGIINPTANTAGFSFIRRLSDVVNVPPLTPGGYSIRLLNGSNATLANYDFTPQQENEAPTLSFGQVVDFVSGTRKVEIVKKADGSVLASQPVSAHPPVISNVALQGAPNPVSGVVTLGWTASDADGDTLSFDVSYSRDNGATFQPVATNLSGSSAQIDTAQLGGSGTAILRVTASDGVNSASADSAPFVMADKPPQPYILTPADNTHIHYEQLVNFSGMALDAQDGTVDSSGLVWKDQSNNTLGSGPMLSLDTLPVGTNVITLRATNSVGKTASASVTVIVDDDLNLPGPTLTTGPDQVGWQVGAGSTQVQTAQISIGNAGSGTLNWTASSSAAWLMLDTGSGSVGTGDPSIITASADPSGLANGTIYTANITIYMPASGSTPAQKAVIPVSLSVGNVRTTPPGHFTGRLLFLPMLKR
jgi:hypothetical protein